MKIFFICSLSDKDKHLKDYKEIVNHLTKKGHLVYSDHVFKRSVKDINKFDYKKHEKEFQKLSDVMRKCDAVVAEISYSSTTVGSFIAYALQDFTPTLLLSKNNYHGLVVGDQNRLMKINNYSSANLGKILDKFEEFVEKRKLSIRFNIMIDKEINQFLTKSAIDQNISKAEYLRRLIQSKIIK